MLTVLDEYTRQALAVAVRTRMRSEDVLEVLYSLFLRHGKPEFIRSDNGPEFASHYPSPTRAVSAGRPDGYNQNLDAVSDQADLWAVWNGFGDADELKQWGENAERERLGEQASQSGQIAQSSRGNF